MTVDKVRASRDGHEYHENWTARKSLQLLMPDAHLTGIAVEGVSPADQANAVDETADIADLTLYSGGLPTFGSAGKTEVLQLKYSVRDAHNGFRASNGKKTFQKFAATYTDYRKKYGTPAVTERLFFQVVTNRPIYQALRDAIEGIANGTALKGEPKTQADQFTKATGLKGARLREFAAKCSLIGQTSDLRKGKSLLSNTIVDWSATRDAIAKVRLGELKQLVRDKAGHAGQGRNLIERTDVLARLEIADITELLPCMPALPEVGEVIERQQLGEAISQMECKEPLLVHAAGGVGKTVFMESLSQAVVDKFETVFFDCFGGGAYRSPDDSRHLPQHGLLQIANSLAFRGLCDPILPGTTDVTGLLRTFRRRLEQAIAAISAHTEGRGLAVFIDAIDNAEVHASDQRERAFPVLLLGSLHREPVNGLQLIVSCRSERIPDTHATYTELPLPGFSIEETRSFVLARHPSGLPDEVRIAHARSGGNPRVLQYLVENDSLIEESATDEPIEVEEIIAERLSTAIDSTRLRGQSQRHIDAFLAGLAVLPPPVPLV